MSKICSKCGLEKDLADFYRDRNHKDGRRSDCKACHTPVVRRYQATDRGQTVAKQADVKRTGTPKRKVSHNRANIRYKKTPKGRASRNACQNRRREWEMGLDSTWTKEDILVVHSRFEHKCFVCASKCNLSIDHHRPLSDGNGLCLKNAVLLCISCNASKSTQHPHEFYAREQLEILNGLGVV